ncbi:MAG: ferrous iron transport protein B [Chloroflexia bacterium]|nr:ferrous iron transport protein B [Chloroflexia bacterium]
MAESKPSKVSLLTERCETCPAATALSPEGASITVALAGQPNVGKSTVFNLLTGLCQHVGNWPGKTVEQKTGYFCYKGLNMSLVDLPGTYSLSANSPEELVAREFIIRERPDVVALVVDAAILERSLYLLAELLHLGAPVVLGLNMVDVAEQHGVHIEAHVLEAALGIPVVPMVATRNQGVHEFAQAIVDVVHDPQPQQPCRPEIREDHRRVMEELLALIHEHVPTPYPKDWVALKLLEGDVEVTRMMRERLPEQTLAQVDAILHQHEDAVLAVAGGRYDWIGRMIRAAVVRPRVGRITMTERIDRIATHPFWGLLLLAGVLALVFWLTYTVAAPIQDWMERAIVQDFARWSAQRLVSAPAWISGLLVDGVIGGVGTMLTFAPILFVFFVAMSFLEDVGYMARAAYVMDRFMHAMGLHGKSFLPLFLGFGCNVPAVLGTRIIEDRRARLMTILLAPLVPCTARLAVLAVLVPAFFPEHSMLVSLGLVLLPLCFLALGGVLINRLVLKNDQAAFIMELPLYHVPNLRTIGLNVWQRMLSFFKKAGTVILGVSVVVWALATLPNGEIETSLLAGMGRWLAPLGGLMGLDWRLLVALMGSFIAKENVLATLGVLYGIGEEGLPDMLSSAVSPASGLAFLVVTMLFIPCVATLAVVRQETNSWRWTLLGTGLLLLLSLLAGMAAYQLATWLL